MSREMETANVARSNKGWFAAHKWLILRRTSQFAVLALFLAGPLTGIWILKGSLAASRLLDTVPLVDPYILLQSVFAGHPASATALTGAVIIAAFYLLVGGRVYCSWVCPVNMITDLAAWLRSRLGWREGMIFSSDIRYWILVMALVLSALCGMVAWELINPVTTLYRGLLFGMGLAWLLPLAVFLFDLLVARRGWCGHLCPVGAFYSLLGLLSPLRVRAVGRQKCTKCMDCYAVCPEPYVISPALTGADEGQGPVILSPNCTNCGRCIDICAEQVFSFGSRFDNR
ncbi:MAG: quinol dehydrogenase ferredoxin subunit NapH [Thermodesulfobacteriota bacterium]